MAIDQSQFQTTGSVSKAPSSYYVKDKTGAVTEVEITRDQFQAPINGYYPLRLKALSPVFVMNGQYGESKCVRAVFQVRAPGNANDKRMFSQPLPIAKKDKAGNWFSNITSNSGPGKMIAAIRGRDIAEGEPLNLLDYLNGDFAAMVNQTVKTGENGIETYANVVKDTWQAVQQQAMPEVVAAAPAAADPFGLDD